MLGVRPHTQLSPYLEMCCLRVSANVSYQHAEEDVEMFTGMRVAAKTQQRLVHHQTFKLPEVEPFVEELSVDGGKIRIRTPEGEPCSWQEYKGVCLHEVQTTGAFFQDNPALIEWVNDQPLATPVTCLGDGHDGVWNIVLQIAPNGQRREILDWFHLVENLHKVGGSLKRLRQAETLLWHGQVDAAMALFVDSPRKAQNFCHYLNKHRNRIVNYQYYQAEQICSIGSGAVESAVKQIDRRTKISGAQWNKENVPQVLAHRCAYLNGMLTI